MAAWQAAACRRCPVLQVKASLGGQPIPRHLLGEHPTPPLMEMAFSTHLDLGVRTQSYCTR